MREMDGEAGLLRESLCQFNLGCAKRAAFFNADAESADQPIVNEQWNQEESVDFVRQQTCSPLIVKFRRGSHIENHRFGKAIFLCLPPFGYQRHVARVQSGRIVEILAARDLPIVVIHVQKRIAWVQACQVKARRSDAQLFADCFQNVTKSSVERGLGRKQRQCPVQCGYLSIGKRLCLLPHRLFGALMLGDIDHECYRFGS